MTTADLLRRIAEAVDNCTENVTVMTPCTDYYARKGDFNTEALKVINGDSFSRALEEIATELDAAE